MPKRVKQPTKLKRPSDPNQWARQLVEESTSEPDTELLIPSPPKGLSAYMSALGRKGGLVSGRRRMKNLSDEQRQEIALKAARARWAQRRKKTKP